MPSNNTNDARSDELDLMELLKKFVAFIRSSAPYVFGLGLVGLTLGILLYWVSPYQYSSKLILHSYFLTNQEHIQIITGWNDLLKHRERAALAEIINCKLETVEKLSKITAEEISKTNPDGNLNGFVVTALVKDPAILDELQAGVKFGLENTEYVKQKLAVRKSNLTTLIRKVSDEIRKLDSVKATVEGALANNAGRGSSPFLIDIGDINIEIIALNEKLYAYEEELKFLSAVQVLQKFNKLNRPVGPLKRTLFPLGLITGMFLGYMIYLLLYLSRKLRSSSHK